MIHEIILSLIGQTGDIIILADKRRNKTKKESNLNIDEYCFEVNNNIHIFLNSEIKIINDIVQLGYYFYVMNIFCLLVKKNTIYKNLTHVHKFNKLSEERKGRTGKSGTRERVQRDEDISSTASTSSNSSSYESSSDNESEDSNNLKNSPQKRQNEKKKQIDNYFGVILKNIKSLNSVSPYGYYANGIGNEISKFMRRYMKKISEIEEYINNNSNTPLTQILTMLEKNREEIIIIINIIKNYLEFQKKEEQNVLEGENRNKTKEIMDYLYENCLSGNSRIKGIYHRYFKSLGKILLHQIFSWILYGQLLDPYYEFFIQKRQFIYSDDKKIFLSPEELYENLTLTNVQSLNFEWNYLFFQSVSNLPECCIDKVVGRKILFIGKSIRILIRSNKWNTSDIVKLFPITKILSKAFDEASPTAGYEQVANFDQVTSSMNPYNGVGSENALKRANGVGTRKGESMSNTNDYLHSLNISSSDSSDFPDEYSSEGNIDENINLYCKEIFDITIEKIRSIIAYKLWKYIVKDINLIKIFDLFRDIYLLNNGDFYDYFLEKSWSLMHTPPNSKNEILLKVVAWKNSSLSVEEYCKGKYENKDKLVLEKYEDDVLFGGNMGGLNECTFLNSTNGYHFDSDNSENIISKYFYPRISYKKFSYDSFEREKYENLVLGGMCYMYDKKIVLNDFFRGIQTLSKKKYYDYDNVFSVCVNNYRQQILRGFKHGFDFSVNFNNFFDNKIADIGSNNGENMKGASVSGNTKEDFAEENFLVGCCFALVIHSMKNPLLYKTDVLHSSLGYWGSLGDCLSVEIKVKFYEKENGAQEDTSSQRHAGNHVQYGDNHNNVVLGDVEVEVSLYIGGKGISSFVHNSNSYTVDYARESILNNKLWADNVNNEKKRLYEDMENEEGYLRKRNVNNADAANQDDLMSDNVEGNSEEAIKQPVLKIQSNKQTFYNINKNTLTKFRVRINCLKHSFSVYIQKLDEYNLQGNNPKNKIKPIIHIRALDMTQAFTLDIGNGYIGFYTCPILFKHKLLKKKNKLNQWFKEFYSETLNARSNIYKKNFFNMGDEKNKEAIQNEMRNINKMILCRNGNNQKKGKLDPEMINCNRDKMKNALLFSSHDCAVEIYKWFHQSYKSPIEIPEIDIDNETLIFYDKQINKNIQIHSGLNLWNNIEIHFKLTWPIALIINTSTIYTYNSIFQFLFLLSRIYYNLKILCYHNRHLYKYLNFKKGGLLFSHLFSIRYKMQFFFFHLIKYLQEDIINYEYKLMITQIHKSKDFEYTKSIHDLYISQVATKCFLRVQDITNPLLELIDTSFKFCYFFQCLIENELFTDILNYQLVDEQEKNKTKKGDMAEAQMNGEQHNDNNEEKDNDLNQVIEKLLQYNDLFNEKLVSVMNEMVNISSNSNHAYLVHFLTTLDFNNYVTKIKDSLSNAKSLGASLTVGGNQNEKTQQGYPIEGNKLDIGNPVGSSLVSISVRDSRRDSNKRDDHKMEYIGIDNVNSIENYYTGEKENYANNLLSGVSHRISGVDYTNEANQLGSNKDFLKKRVVNKFSNLLHSDVEEKWGIQPSGINQYSRIGMSESVNKSVLNGPPSLSRYDSYNRGGIVNNNYNALIDKYSNILNSYMNNSDASNSVYQVSQNYMNNSHMDAYNTSLDVAKLRYIGDGSHVIDSGSAGNAISVGPELGATNFNVHNLDAGINNNNNVPAYENSLASNMSNLLRKFDVNGKMDLSTKLNLDSKSNLSQNLLSDNRNAQDSAQGNAPMDLSSLHDLNIKQNFNVQNLLDNYNYSYKGFSEKGSYTGHNLDQMGNDNKLTSQRYNVPSESNYGNTPMNLYRNENSNINEVNREK
ncbi:spindle pole body protein, putative [Plasmodium knowlesi strain H]|uniref:Spindle pole body protein, putative n=3 Tax=Plasmodium knowlesi TaxID=5850 RepID=A0A5K1VMZ8_PLAKH|nr:gamma-tubulin complex component, putative [Plasmodium knowlesi strain H]OTN65542.1 putative Spindle pole body protein [Plasmodium knowlesi]CAA9989714.1 gamma-tubulin complex component, putative [Plasmodium knowlesi strain H]SBO22868.1 spindle pole body protein, putative [Plasmodium knowlesi strain H]SBO23033.1 spindle pole body protein, putative [Plasmodium knowlesi strain H]VVS79188.1 gamma-tubulin complex component, putative [Plasmodium knowlesi strain H]|eukprot:XP_002260437.1 spindle pole body protein, putative [Plasmodium knowlesi strain H]